MATFQGSPAAQADDGYWTNDLNIFENGSGPNNIAGLALGPLDGDHNIFIRFPNVTIPAGATITAATLTLMGDGEVAATGEATIAACDEDDSAQIASAADAAGRDQTSAVVQWETGGTGDNVAAISPDIASVLQEVIDRGGWESGNALQLFVLQDDLDTFTAYDGWDTAGDDYAVLDVTYTAPASGGGGIGSARFNRLLKPA